MVAPSASDSFVMRICKALDMQPEDLAKASGVDWEDFEPMLTGDRRLLVGIEDNPVWWQILNYTSERIAMLLAVRRELDRFLQDGRVKNAIRNKRFKDVTARRNDSAKT